MNTGIQAMLEKVKYIRIEKFFKKMFFLSRKSRKNGNIILTTGIALTK